jgi:hypothetical protein
MVSAEVLLLSRAVVDAARGVPAAVGLLLLGLLPATALGNAAADPAAVFLRITASSLLLLILDATLIALGVTQVED